MKWVQDVLFIEHASGIHGIKRWILINYMYNCDGPDEEKILREVVTANLHFAHVEENLLALQSCTGSYQLKRVTLQVNINYIIGYWLWFETKKLQSQDNICTRVGISTERTLKWSQRSVLAIINMEVEPMKQFSQGGQKFHASRSIWIGDLFDHSSGDPMKRPDANMNFIPELYNLCRYERNYLHLPILSFSKTHPSLKSHPGFNISSYNERFPQVSDFEHQNKFVVSETHDRLACEEQSVGPSFGPRQLGEHHASHECLSSSSDKQKLLALLKGTLCRTEYRNESFKDQWIRLVTKMKIRVLAKIERRETPTQWKYMIICLYVYFYRYILAFSFKKFSFKTLLKLSQANTHRQKWRFAAFKQTCMHAIEQHCRSMH